MELYIHYGIYKTGSSFLQTNAAKNRKILFENGYYFPESIREKDMIEGRISPGNGNGIALYLQLGDEKGIKKLLKQWVTEAAEKKCDKILISDEALIHGFALASNLKLLHNILERLGFEKIFCLGFFRNPVDHCLSTLKHRAKKGTIADFEDWIMNKYETYNVVENFLANINMVSFHWDFQLYQSDGRLMADYFFKNWLGINNMPSYYNITVNPSLTLSELAVLNSIRKVDSRLVKYVYHGFLKLKPIQKADDTALNQYYKIISNKKLQQHKAVVDALNNVFKKTVFPLDSVSNVTTDGKPDLHLNENQIFTLSQSLKEAHHLKNYTKDTLLKMYRYFKP
jgi:hypothetical protein